MSTKFGRHGQLISVLIQFRMWNQDHFLPRDAMHKRGLCRHAVSVRLCVRLLRSWILSKRVIVSSDFFHRRVDHHSSFSTPNGMALFRRDRPNGSVKCKGVWKKNTILEQYLALSRRWCQLEPYLLRKANRKLYPSFRMVPFWMTLSDL